MPKPLFEVVSDEEAEKADAVICMPADTPSPFTDNEFGTCSRCGKAVMFRPSSPKKPPRICFDCAMSEAKATRH